MSWRVACRAKHPVIGLAIVVLLFGLLPPVTSIATSTASVNRGTYSASTFLLTIDTIAFESPIVTTSDVDNNAIIVAQVVARGASSVSNVWICPLQAGWTPITRVAEVGNLVQQLWWRPASTPQDAQTQYTFQSRSGGCSAVGGEPTSMAGGLTVYTGVDPTNPVAEIVSVEGMSTSSRGSAPAATISHTAGSRVVRYFGTGRNGSLGPVDASQVYTVFNSDYSRAVAAFDTLLATDGPAGAFEATFGGAAYWLATTMVLRPSSAPTGPTDTTPPSAIATTTPYEPGTWTNADVNISLSAEDPDGSGVKEIVYRASGAQPIDETTVAGATTSLTITAEGVTTVEYASRDNADNRGDWQQVVVKIDRTLPNLTGAPTIAPNVDRWYSSDVTINWTCSDALSGIDGGCPVESVISGEGEALSAAASVRDLAGNEATASVGGIKIDRTAPVTTFSAPAAWSGAPVDVTLTAEDNLAGVRLTHYRVNNGPEQTGETVTLSTSGVHTITYWSVDFAGNVEAARTAEVWVDRDAPSISHTLSSPANANGWHRGPVTVTFECADSPSGIASCTEPQTLSSDGANQVVTGVAVDNAGNTATDNVTISIDSTAPVIEATVSPEAGVSGWANASVSVSFECSDALSGILNCPDAVTLGEGADQSATGIATDRAGNTSSVTVSGINVDTTPPSITATAAYADGKPYTPGTWVNTSVTVTFICDDALSTIASCPAPQTVHEGANQSVTGVAFDVAGNSASVTVDGINVDATAPSISAVLKTVDETVYSPGSWARQPVRVQFDCSDALSGVSTCTSPQVLGESVDQTITGTVVDAAGNSTSITVGDIHIDMTAPTIVAVPTTGDGKPYVPGTWTNQTVTVSFTCDDVGSGLAGTCPPPVVVDSSTSIEGRPVSAQVGDRVGWTTSSPIVLVKVDKDAPVFTSEPDDQVVEATSDAGAEVSWPAPVALDGIAGALTPVCSAVSGALFPLGDTVVTCTAADPVGNVAEIEFTVSVVDTQPPELHLPEAIVVPADSPSGAVVMYDVGDAGARATTLPTCSPPSGSHFRVGTTLVTCSATDGAGNTATASFNVIVVGAADLLKTLRVDTLSLVKNRSHERVLLRPLDRAEQAVKTGQTMRAYTYLLQYRVQIILFTQFGLLPRSVGEQLQTGVEQVTNAMF